ncbi:MAG: ABC transporter substrate-binding protein [Lachnospiraceae bacterium]|nr:ABC transporter substrate-binding protein [Lachnospiraceae bacterium]
MKKKVLSVLLCTGLVISLATGCGGTKSTDGGKTDAGTAEKSSDAIQYVSMWSDTEPQAATIKEAAAAFEKETGTKVEIEFAGRQGIREGLQTRLDAGENIDMFDEDIDRVTGQWGKYLLDLKDYVNADYKGKVYKDYINPNLASLYTVAETLSGDGTLKVVPYQPFLFNMVYNKTIFKEAGVTEVPKTWDAFLAACEKIKASGKTPITVDNAYISCLLGYTMASYVGADGVEKIVTDNDWSNEAVLKSVAIWQEMYEKGYISEYAATNVYPNAQVTEFATGDAAMYLNGSWLANEIKADIDPSVELGMFAFPAIEGGQNGTEAANYGSQVLAINKDSDKADEAFQFIAFLTTGEWDQKLSENTLGIPMDADNTWPKELSDVENLFKTITTRYPWAANIDNNSDNQATILENFTAVISGGMKADEFVKAMSK